MKRIQVCSNERPCRFQGEIITKQRKYIDEIKKESSSPEPLDQFQPNLSQCILGWRGLRLYKWRAQPFSMERWLQNSENTLKKLKKILFSRTTEPISTNLGTKHPWVRGIEICTNVRKQKILIKLIRFKRIDLKQVTVFDFLNPTYIYIMSDSTLYWLTYRAVARVMCYVILLLILYQKLNES